MSAPTLRAAAPADADHAIRPTTRADLPRCVELINRTHAGQDLFRPYTVEFFEGVLDEGTWAEKPFWWNPVYGWEDHVVLERGRVAERWRSERWDSLRLLTANWQTRLPGWSYQGPDAEGFMNMPELISYLEGYATSFAAPPYVTSRR